jgi:RHS repeat-associated protein
VSSSGSLTTPFGFTGVYTDAESGLLAATHRYYDPVTATWLTTDPAVSSTMQPYQYAIGSPVNHRDPGGLLSIGDISGDQVKQLMTACSTYGELAGLCASAAFCPSEMACSIVQQEAWGLSSALGQKAMTMANDCGQNHVLTLERQAGTFAYIAGLSREYYSGGGIGQHLSAGINDAGTGMDIGGVGGFAAGIPASPFFGPETPAVTGLFGTIGGAIGGALYGLATGHDRSIDEIFGEIRGLAENSW